MKKMEELMANFSGDGLDSLEHTEAVEYIKWIAYSVVAYVIVGVGILGNLASLVVLTRPNLKGVMYVYLLGITNVDYLNVITHFWQVWQSQTFAF